MHVLYPEIDIFAKGMRETGDDHFVYYEQAGRPDGIPVIFLHGGPGSGCNPNHRRYFNPDIYRIVIFDQRGCNRSAPQGSINNNTTQHLLQDIEAIRKLLKIEKWLVFGGSWGATLGLLYAETYPERVAGMILRGVFLARQSDLDWFAKEGVNRVLPEHWEQFVRDIPQEERQDLIAAYHKRLADRNEVVREKFARLWSDWATRVVTWNLTEQKNEAEDIRTTKNQVSIETHYAFHRYFIKENQILDNISKIPEVPVIIVHGRKDLTCTPESSWLLHKALAQSELLILPDAGHLAGEPAMVDALVSATDRMAYLTGI
jgi:proline iminopeptidase